MQERRDVTRILIVEDQVMLRDLLATTINAQPDMQVVAQESDASRAMELVEACDIDLALMDVCTEHDSNGITAAKLIKEKHPNVKVIIMTGMAELTFLDQAREANVDSFVYKSISSDSLIGVIRSTAEGLSTMPREKPEAFDGAWNLTPAELEVLRQVCLNRSRKQIAETLYVSESTVKSHISNILTKTGYDSILRLAVHAVANGNIAPQLLNKDEHPQI